MKRLKLPQLKPAKKPPGKHRITTPGAHRGSGRATSSSGPGKHRQEDQKVIPPWSQRKNYQGPLTPAPKPGKHAARRQQAPARRETPADDRGGFVARFFR